MHKELFSNHRKSKLQPRGDDPFQVLERINENAYKIDLPSEYSVSTTFNVADITLFGMGFDSRPNPFKEIGDDMDQPANTKDPLHVPSEPITRFKVKALKEALNGLVVQVSAKSELGDPLKHQKNALVNLIYVQEGSRPSLFEP
jgi:hypothetical protein